MKPIRFIHSADLHLGSPLKTVGAMSTRLQQILQEASFNSVKRLVDAALLLHVDFVLFSGDIYDRDSRSVKANAFFAQQMERLREKDIPVCIIYGNHDPLGTSADLYKMPSNVHVFSCHEPECFAVTDSEGNLIARIFGQSYGTAAESRKMHLNFAPPDSEVLNIGMLHTALTPDTTAYVPSSLEELRQVPHIHYWALGHIHRREICSKEIPAAAFPGIPQGRDISESGIGGCLLVEAKGNQVPGIKFLPLSQIIWLTEKLTINNEYPEDLDSLEDMIISRGQEIIAHDAAHDAENFRSSIPLADLHPLTDLDVADTSTSQDEEPKGYIIRWEISGRGPLHEALAEQDREELSETLAIRLRQRLGYGSPFLWTEAVHFQTAAPIGDLWQLAEEDPVLRTLFAHQQEFKEQPELRQELEAVLGKVWYRQQDAEDLQEDRLPYDDAKLNEMLDQAYALVLDKIIGEREASDY